MYSYFCYYVGKAAGCKDSYDVTQLYRTANYVTEFMAKWHAQSWANRAGWQNIRQNGGTQTCGHTKVLRYWYKICIFQVKKRNVHAFKKCQTSLIWVFS